MSGHDLPPSDHNTDPSRIIIEALNADATHEPPAWLDATIRSMIVEPTRRFVLRPLVAFGLALGSFGAMVTGVAHGLADSGLGELGPGIALGAGLAYLALSTAVVLPLLYQSRLSPVAGRVHA